ncbi:4Fe-4S dicluster domain-containing protein [Thermococcus sp. MV11]|uniref:4Fe-4S dicluster domain-containing protein n=1 Tax=Thermococcus sp. MV11 TaxID=1638267 RepID=UPI00142F99F5|nr:4Fe-4S dicluster domain-containing protein [Thermococcus sp. MV11]NJE04163.1 4Fe-4S dicluster domain-containing protein [Thermococcus sp. MV11]
MKLLVDFNACIGCETCEAVCDFIHDGRPNIRVVFASNGVGVPISCRHCDDAPCMAVCPVNAITRDRDGAVVINHEKCIGCLMCLSVCPFGAISYEPVVKVVYKCDMCAERRAEGLKPACHEMCPANAIYYGPDGGEEKRKRVAEAISRER